MDNGQIHLGMIGDQTLPITRKRRSNRHKKVLTNLHLVHSFITIFFFTIFHYYWFYKINNKNNNENRYGSLMNIMRPVNRLSRPFPDSFAEVNQPNTVAGGAPADS